MELAVRLCRNNPALMGGNDFGWVFCTALHSEQIAASDSCTVSGSCELVLLHNTVVQMDASHLHQPALSGANTIVLPLVVGKC